jgi:hypothetical protein
MSIDGGPSSLHWVAVGARASGLVFAGRIVALLYWQGAQPAELGEPGVPAVGDAGFSWVPTDVPVDRFFLFGAPNPAEGDWARARELAAGAYLEWMRREADRTAELRKEAVELLSRSRWWRDERVREQLLGRTWRGTRRSERR